MNAELRLFSADGNPVSMPLGNRTSMNKAGQRLLSQCKPTAYVSGTGHFLPDLVVTNEKLAFDHALRFRGKEGDSPQEFSADVFDRTGILERRHAFHEPSLSQLAVGAMREAVREAGIQVSEVSHVIIGSTFFGMSEEQFSGQIRDALGCPNIVIELLEYACASAGYCVERAVQILKTNASAQHILVVGADKGSSFINFCDPGTAVLFGDGAGALVVSRRGGDIGACSGIIDTTSSYMPEHARLIYLGSDCKIAMPNGPGVFQQACRAVKGTVQTLLSSHALDQTDVDLLLLHQANMRLPASTAKTFELGVEKVPTDIRYYGNTCAASPLILTSEAAKFGLLERGDLVILAAVGMGMRSSGVLLSW